jgi:hypothetical protein
VSQASPELLGETLGITLEEAAFVFAEPEARPPPFPGTVLEARIGYQGPNSGELRLLADARLAATLAANLLGEDEGEGTAGRAGDAVGELLNMIVGAWVVRLFGPETRCRLGVPAVRELGPAEAGSGPAGATCGAHLLAEEGRRIDLFLLPAPEDQAP